MGNTQENNTKTKKQNQQKVPSWFDAIATFDALCSLANYAYNHPDFTTPVPVKEDFLFSQNLNSTQALQLFRICQEAIANACKYAESASLLLQGNAQQTFFEIVIQDLGKGFDINNIGEEGHYGLKNMQQRAKSVNAALVITAATGQGTAIKVKI